MCHRKIIVSYIREIIIIILAIGWICQFCYGQDVKQSLRFEDTTYDFGIVRQEQATVVCKFKFTNINSEEIRIDKIVPGCGCTNVRVSKEGSFSSGESGEILAKLDVKDRQGFQRVSLAVHTNKDTTAPILLTIRGFVKVGIRAVPKDIYLGEIYKNETYTKSLLLYHFISPEDKELVIRGIETSSEFIKCRYIDKEKINKKVEDESIIISSDDSNANIGRTEVLKFEVVVGPTLPKGELAETITISFLTKEDSEIKIPIRGKVKGEVSVFPETVHLGFLTEIDDFSKSIRVTSRLEKFHIVRVEPQPQWLLAKVVEIDSPKEYEIKLSLGTDTPSGKIKGMIKIYTNDREEPVIEIPVVGWIGN